MKEAWVIGWRGLPEWMKKDIRRGCREHWVYSGMMEIGWSFSSGFGGMGFGEDLMEGEEGEVIVVSPQYLMEWLRGLVGGGEFKSFMDGDIVLEMRYGEDLWVGRGEDRELAFMSLLKEVGEWYWLEKRPTFGDISKRNLLFGEEYEGEIELEIRDIDGELEIYFGDFWVARKFMSGWNKFVLEENKGVSYGTGDYYHGRVLLVEGECRVMSSCISRVNSNLAGYGGMHNVSNYNVNCKYSGGIGYTYNGGNVSMGDVSITNSLGEEVKLKVDEIFGVGGDRMN